MTLLKGDILLIFCFPIFAVLGQVIQIHPTDRKVFIDDDDGAFFSCITRDSSTSHWRLNETDYDDLPTETRDDLIIDTASTVHSQLIDMTIPARAKYNGTRVQCVAESDGGNPIVSDTATLRMQGLLASVGSFIVNYGVSSIIISWSAPFSLDVTGVDPDIKYSVLIYNVTDNPTAIPCTDCINITETHYTFTPDYPSPCHKYIFTVIPLNGAGQGHSSENISTYDEIPTINITMSHITAVDINTSTVIFNISGEVEKICDYTLQGVSDDGSGRIENISVKRDDPVENEGNIAYTLPTHRFYYSMYFEIKTAAGPVKITSENFTTFDLKNFKATEENDKIEVSAEFITNSPAKGCFLVIECDASSADTFQAIKREKRIIDESIRVHSSNFIVYAYDLEENALPYTMPANIPPESQISITTGTELTNQTSPFLKNASLSHNGSSVAVYCELADEYPTATCVLVYREYGNTTLNFAVFKENTTFPITITGENYTFAVFGRNGDKHIDRVPLESERIVFDGNVSSAQVIFEANKIPETVTPSPTLAPSLTPTPTPTPSYFAQSSSSSSSSAVVAVVVCGMMVIVFMIFELPVAEEGKYASVEAVRGPRPPPSLDQRVMIDLKATKRHAHPQGLLYAELPGDRGGSSGVRREGIAVDGLDTVQYVPIPSDDDYEAAIPQQASDYGVSGHRISTDGVSGDGDGDGGDGCTEVVVGRNVVTSPTGDDDTRGGKVMVSMGLVEEDQDGVSAYFCQAIPLKMDVDDDDDNAFLKPVYSSSEDESGEESAVLASHEQPINIKIKPGLMITGRMDTKPADNDMIIADQLISLHLDSRKTADGKCQGSYNSDIYHKRAQAWTRGFQPYPSPPKAHHLRPHPSIIIKLYQKLHPSSHFRATHYHQLLHYRTLGNHQTSMQGPPPGNSDPTVGCIQLAVAAEMSCSVIMGI